MAVIVPGAPRQPLPFGLFSTFTFRPEGDGHWQGINGVTFESLPCEQAAGLPLVDCPPVETFTEDPLAPTFGEALPFAIYGWYSCSPVGNNVEGARRLAIDHLTAREEARVEMALVTGNLGNVPNLSGANGYPAPADLGTAPDVLAALALVEQEVAERYGSLGVIHMNRATAVLLKGALSSSGSTLRTKVGTPVAAGVSYPDGFIYGTPALFGYHSEVYHPEDVPGALFDRSNNVLTVFAARSYLIGFDPCGPVQAQFSAPVPTGQTTTTTTEPTTTTTTTSV